MKQDIFKTLKNYSAGYHRNATKAENTAYDAKVEELTKRIEADIEHAPEIIAEEFEKVEVAKYRIAFTSGRSALKINDAEWKAIDNVMEALIDSRPLKK